MMTDFEKTAAQLDKLTVTYDAKRKVLLKQLKKDLQSLVKNGCANIKLYKRYKIVGVTYSTDYDTTLDIEEKNKPETRMAMIASEMSGKEYQHYFQEKTDKKNAINLLKTIERYEVEIFDIFQYDDRVFISAKGGMKAYCSALDD